MYLVFDVGGTYIKYALMTADGDILKKNKKKTPFTQEHTSQDFVDIIAEIYHAEKKEFDIEGIAMDLPGQIDCEKGYVYLGGAIPCLDHVYIGDRLSEACDGLIVTMENDGKAAALAEVWKGNAQDVQNAVVIALGTGVGGGIIIDRKVYHGTGMIAGEFSYMLSHVNRDSLDSYPSIDSFTNVYDAFEAETPISSTYIATSALCYQASKVKNLPFSEVTGEQIYAWAKAGDSEMIDLLENYYFEIAKTVTSLYVILNPDVVLFGGGISAEPMFIEGMQRYVDKFKRLSDIYTNLRIDTCKFRNDSNLYGALYNYLQMTGQV